MSDTQEEVLKSENAAFNLLCGEQEVGQESTALASATKSMESFHVADKEEKPEAAGNATAVSVTTVAIPTTELSAGVAEGEAATEDAKEDVADTEVEKDDAVTTEVAEEEEPVNKGKVVEKSTKRKMPATKSSEPPLQKKPKVVGETTEAIPSK
eukprot:190141_1